MKQLLKLVLVTMLLAGCQSTAKIQPIPENIQTYLVTNWVTTGFCYKEQQYSLEEHTSYQQAINYLLSTWMTNQESINKETTKLTQIINKMAENSTKEQKIATCREWQPNMVRIKNNASTHFNQIQLANKRRHEINKANASATKVNNYGSSGTQNSFNANVQCTKVGDFSGNVQTFKYSCPLGWIMSF